MFNVVKTGEVTNLIAHTKDSKRTFIFSFQLLILVHSNNTNI